jgi:teichuronic acid biosynthesis glycosyltransferase TuaC
MKVLVFSSLYPNNRQPNRGVFVKERMTAVSRMDGCEVRVVAPVPYFPAIRLGRRWEYSQIVEREDIEGVTVHHPKYGMIPKVSMWLHGFLMFLGTLPLVHRIHRQWDFDVIDAHYVYPDGFAAVLLGQVLGKPVVVTARGSDINQFTKFRSIRPFLRYTLAHARHGITVCQALKNEMTSLDVPGAKLTVIPNGVDTRKFYLVSRPAARKQLGLPDGRIVVAVGHLIARKGFDVLLRAVKILVDERRMKDLAVAIIGEGICRAELEALIARLDLGQVVRLVGAVPHNELVNWYAAADLSCLASDREGWANVVLESMACGTPVVATAVWGTPEIIRSDRVGLLTQREPRLMADTLWVALNRSWSAEEISAYASAYTWERAARAVMTVLETTIGLDAARPGGAPP